MKKIIYLLTFSLGLWSCEGFLEEKPSKTIDTPQTLESLQGLLDNSGTMNFYSPLGLIMSGEYFSDDAGIGSLEPWQQNLYLWKSDPFQIDDLIFDWRNFYNQIQIANVVLEALEGIEKKDSRWNEIKGTALFFRAHAYFNLSTLFLDGPNLKGDGLEIRIPVRRSTEITQKPELADTEEIKQIIREDLEEAASLLPDQVSFPFRPTKNAAKALKARIHLDWEEYDQALIEAQELINSGIKLMDYKELNPSTTYPFELFNKEVIWQARIGGYSFMFSQSSFQVDPELYSLYKSGDLRKSLFYIKRTSGLVNFRGSYDGSISLFGGLASDEVYLTYAECLARRGKLQESADAINVLLGKRYSIDFEPLKFSSENDALDKIIMERRKELAFRGLRWGDLRRLNSDDRFKQVLIRTYAGEEYKLLPESKNYLLPIPAREFSFY